jgi:hypothetical protein
VGNINKPRKQLPGRSPQPKPSPKVVEEVEQEIPSVPLALPKMSPKPRMNATKVVPPPLPAVNKTMAKMPPAPSKVIVWSVAPACKGKPDGQNSEPGGWAWRLACFMVHTVEISIESTRFPAGGKQCANSVPVPS